MNSSPSASPLPHALQDGGKGRSGQARGRTRAAQETARHQRRVRERICTLLYHTKARGEQASFYCTLHPHPKCPWSPSCVALSSGASVDDCRTAGSRTTADGAHTMTDHRRLADRSCLDSRRAGQHQHLGRSWGTLDADRGHGCHPCTAHPAALRDLHWNHLIEAGHCMPLRSLSPSLAAVGARHQPPRSPILCWQGESLRCSCPQI